MSNMFANVPFWALALVLAGAAPWCAGLLQSILEERRRERTRKLLRNVGLPVERTVQAPKPRAPRDISSEGDEDT
jgi:hypothetical protein